MISIRSTIEPSAALSSIRGLILLSLVTSKGENLESSQLGINSLVEFYYGNVLRSIYEDLLNITPKREKTLSQCVEQVARDTVRVLSR
jgi:hypothetical protein